MTVAQAWGSWAGFPGIYPAPSASSLSSVLLCLLPAAPLGFGALRKERGKGGDQASGLEKAFWQLLEQEVGRAVGQQLDWVSGHPLQLG